MDFLMTDPLQDDDSNTITSEFDRGKPITTKTTWTLLLYLTSAADGCRGGETVFFPNDRRVAKEEVAVAPETGMVLLHKHGDDCMLVSGPTSCGNLAARLPVPITVCGSPVPYWGNVANYCQKSSMKAVRLLLVRNGSSGAIFALVNSCIQSILREEKQQVLALCHLLRYLKWWL